MLTDGQGKAGRNVAVVDFSARALLSVLTPLGMLTEEDLARFSPQTQAAVQVWLGA